MTFLLGMGEVRRAVTRAAYRQMSSAVSACMILSVMAYERGSKGNLKNVQRRMPSAVTSGASQSAVVNVMPVDALVLDGRVIALSTQMTYEPGFSVYGSRSIVYNPRSPCLANRFAVNVLLYGLIQPGAIGTRMVTSAR